MRNYEYRRAGKKKACGRRPPPPPRFVHDFFGSFQAQRGRVSSHDSSEGLLQYSFVRVQGVLGRPGGLMGASRDILGRSSGPLGATWVPLGDLAGRPGRSLGRLWRFLGHAKPSKHAFIGDQRRSLANYARAHADA